MKMPDDQPHDDELASYLTAFRQDVVPAHAKKKTLVALGLGAVTVTSSTAVAASAIFGASRITVIAVVKSIAGGALAGAVMMGATSYIQDHAATDPSAQAVRSEGSRPQAPRAIAREQGDQVATQTEDLRVVEAPSNPSEAAEQPATPLMANPQTVANPQTAPRVADKGARNELPAEPRELESPLAFAAAPQAVGLPASTLAREVLVLDQARAALARRDVRSAGSLLDGYAREFANGKLSPEATMLRVELLLLSGDLAGAQAIARAFEHAHPGDSHLRRLHSLLSR